MPYNNNISDNIIVIVFFLVMQIARWCARCSPPSQVCLIFHFERKKLQMMQNSIAPLLCLRWHQCRTADGHPPVTFAIASQETDDVRVTDSPFFTMGPSNSGDFTAKDMWDEIKKRGSFRDAGTHKAPGASKPGSSIGAAVAASTTVPAGGTRVVSFALSWSCPEVKFSTGRTYHR